MKTYDFANKSWYGTLVHWCNSLGYTGTLVQWYGGTHVTSLRGTLSWYIKCFRDHDANSASL